MRLLTLLPLLALLTAPACRPTSVDPEPCDPAPEGEVIGTLIARQETRDCWFEDLQQTDGVYHRVFTAPPSVPEFCEALPVQVEEFDFETGALLFVFVPSNHTAAVVDVVQTDEGEVVADVSVPAFCGGMQPFDLFSWWALPADVDSTDQVGLAVCHSNPCDPNQIYP